jgi:hypothetical protein
MNKQSNSIFQISYWLRTYVGTNVHHLYDEVTRTYLEG